VRLKISTVLCSYVKLESDEAKVTDLAIVKLPDIPSSIESSYLFIIDPPFC